ncbi:hypothetical protein L2U69_08645 [Zavarzinia compransoris]|uniref:hypothetical protein n=1 Tax=Zavarzinia marina TaxID=2911065 RepID=UPI001F3054F8|nr:hypothetical protein [Zavarzinia marina]MCF4165708.1 hypothetical protein [Zavarzinia marina]
MRLFNAAGFRAAGPALASAALAAVLAVAVPAPAVQFEAGAGISLELSPFAGYCALDETRTTEANLIRSFRERVSESMRLVLAFGDCEELVEFRDGTRPFLNRFGQILLVAQSGEVQPVSETRGEYLANVARSFPTATFEEVAANGEAQFDAARPADAPRPLFAVVGRDELALYIATASLQGQDDNRIKVAGVAGVTVVRQLPLTVNLFSAYAGDAATGTATLEDLHLQMAAGIADLQFVNEDVEKQAALPPPSRGEWRAMGSTALVGALVGGLIGGIGAMVIILLRRRRRPAAPDETEPEVETEPEAGVAAEPGTADASPDGDGRKPEPRTEGGA